VKREHGFHCRKKTLLNFVWSKKKIMRMRYNNKKENGLEETVRTSGENE
jgi:hypothetical protein